MNHTDLAAQESALRQFPPARFLLGGFVFFVLLLTGCQDFLRDVSNALGNGGEAKLDLAASTPAAKPRAAEVEGAKPEAA